MIMLVIAFATFNAADEFVVGYTSNHVDRRQVQLRCLVTLFAFETAFSNFTDS